MTPAPEDEREEFVNDLAPHITDTLDTMGIEDADLLDGRAVADLVYCLGYRKARP